MYRSLPGSFHTGSSNLDLVALDLKYVPVTFLELLPDTTMNGQSFTTKITENQIYFAFQSCIQQRIQNFVLIIFHKYFNQSDSFDKRKQSF